MSRWENNILGLIPEAEWLNTEFNPTRQSDPIDGLFDDQKTDNLVAQWQSIADEYQIPVMAQFHGFDTEANTTFRAPIDTHNIEKGLIKVKLNQSERMRALLRAGVREDALYDYVINDGIRLADQVITRTKVAKNELMATGKVTIKENNLELTVDYGVSAAQTGIIVDFSEDADIPAQIQSIIDSALAKGTVLTGILTSRAMLTKMRMNRAVQKVIGGIYATGAMVNRSALDAWLEEEFGITTIVTNDLTYGAAASIGSDGRPSVATKRYYPANKISFFATQQNGRLGTGLWGDPPEVDLSNMMKGEASSVSPYVYVSQYQENDPAVLWTKASSLFMPVLFNPTSLYIATDNAAAAPKAKALDPTATVYGITVSDLGTDILVGENAISGTLKYIASGEPATTWGAGNFLPITFVAEDWSKYVSVKVGVDPSAGSGLVELIGHLDELDSIFKITNEKMQKLVIIANDGVMTKTKEYDLSGLTLLGGQG